MTENLQISIDQLYQTFSSYPLNPKIEGCPCCVSDTDKSKLHSQNLKDLQDDDLSKYAFKAMTTWGELNDFKYYLPRIFELMASTDFSVDTFVILGKLEYGKWESWDEVERNAIKDFLLNWWKDITSNSNEYVFEEHFTEIHLRISDLPSLLNLWEISFHDQSIINLVSFIFHHYTSLKKSASFSKVFSEKEKLILSRWLYNKREDLENAFFFFEESNTEFSNQISDVIYIMEHS